jgi:hypothetical protein
MAQNDIQRYASTEDFHANILNVLEQWFNNDFKLLKLDNHLGTASAADYPVSPLTDLAELRTLLATLLASSDYVAFKTKVKEFIRI